MVSKVSAWFILLFIYLGCNRISEKILRLELNKKRNHTKRPLTRWKYGSVSQTSPLEKLCRWCSLLPWKQTRPSDSLSLAVIHPSRAHQAAAVWSSVLLPPLPARLYYPIPPPSSLPLPPSLPHSASSATQRYFCSRSADVQWRSEQSRGGKGALLVSGSKVRTPPTGITDLGCGLQTRSRPTPGGSAWINALWATTLLGSRSWQS